MAEFVKNSVLMVCEVAAKQAGLRGGYPNCNAFSPGVEELGCRIGGVERGVVERVDSGGGAEHGPRDAQGRQFGNGVGGSGDQGVVGGDVVPGRLVSGAGDKQDSILRSRSETWAE